MNKILFLTMHTRYSDVQYGLFNNNQLIECITYESKKISAHFFEHITQLLSKHNLTIEELAFIAAHQGPAPYTTLRVVLASINGLSYVKKIPLVAVNGLPALLHEYEQDTQITISLLNAFCNDIYYGIYSIDQPITMGSAPLEQFLSDIAVTYSNKPITFIGNGVLLYRQQILKTVPHAIIPDPLPELASLQALGQEALKIFNEHKQITYEIMPLYLKASVVSC